MPAIKPECAPIDVDTLCDLHRVSNDRLTLDADVVRDLIRCRFLLGQMYGTLKNLSPGNHLLIDVHAYFEQRGYLR